MTGIYRPPDPPIGPDRTSDASPLTDRAEVVAARHVPTGEHIPGAFLQPRELRVTLRWSGPEQFASHEQYAAAAREIWGDDL